MPPPLHRPLAPVGRKRGRVEPCGFEVVPIEKPGECGAVEILREGWEAGAGLGVPWEGWEAGIDLGVPWEGRETGAGLGVPREGQEMGTGTDHAPRAAPWLVGCSQAKVSHIPQ